jgi:hypothetical protein
LLISLLRNLGDSNATQQLDDVPISSTSRSPPNLSDSARDPSTNLRSRIYSTRTGASNSLGVDAERRRRNARSLLRSQVNDELLEPSALHTSSDHDNDLITWDMDDDFTWIPSPNRPTSTGSPSVARPNLDDLSQGMMRPLSTSGVLTPLEARSLPSPLQAPARRMDESDDDEISPTSSMSDNPPMPARHLDFHLTPAQQYEQMLPPFDVSPSQHSFVPTSSEAAAMFASSSSQAPAEEDYPSNTHLSWHGRYLPSTTSANIPLPRERLHSRLSSNPSSQLGPRRNIDLNDGPFHASLQRFVDIDRMRSRLREIQSEADTNRSSSSNSRSNPPSLPPLPFERRQTLGSHEPLVPSPVPPSRVSFITLSLSIGTNSFDVDIRT